MFRPFDMSDDEYRDRIEVREEIPSLLVPPLATWTVEQVSDYNSLVSLTRVHKLQSTLQVPLEPQGAYTDSRVIVEQVVELGVRKWLWLVDFLLSETVAYTFDPEPPVVRNLIWHLDQTRSSLAVAPRDGVYRLTHRLPEGVEDALVSAVEAANEIAGRHLSEAVHEATTMDGKTSSVMTEGIRAVEAAAGPVVTPKDKRFQLGKIVGALKDKNDWSLVLQRRDDDEPDHQAVLIGMLETLAFAQQDRHSGTAPSAVQAQAHMMLAATLVGWFSTGVVQME